MIFKNNLIPSKTHFTHVFFVTFKTHSEEGGNVLDAT